MTLPCGWLNTWKYLDTKESISEIFYLKGVPIMFTNTSLNSFQMSLLDMLCCKLSEHVHSRDVYGPITIPLEVLIFCLQT